MTRWGGVPAIEEVRFSVIHNRGCFGACNFCSLAFHQGRIISSAAMRAWSGRSRTTRHPGFKGYIHDLGGPTANSAGPPVKSSSRRGSARTGHVSPETCPNVDADHTDYLMLLPSCARFRG